MKEIQYFSVASLFLEWPIVVVRKLAWLCPDPDYVHVILHISQSNIEMSMNLDMFSYHAYKTGVSFSGIPKFIFPLCFLC